MTRKEEIDKEVNTLYPFDWKYMLWRIKLAQKWFNNKKDK